MPDTAVRIARGPPLIDTAAWVRQRASEPLPELTAALREFTDHPAWDQYHPKLDVSHRMELWCAARGWTASEETTYYLDDSCLTEAVNVVLATDGDRRAYALVQIGTDNPDVMFDRTTDDDYWLQIRPVDIVCPGGHRWTWLDHLSLLDEHGTHIPFVELFGRDPGAPYAECRDCLADYDGERDQPCQCDSRDTIYCPTCDQRCRLELTAVPTFCGQVQR